jgi:hypothetical protein
MMLTSVESSAHELQYLTNLLDYTGDQPVRVRPRGCGKADHVALCCICPPPTVGLIE